MPTPLVSSLREGLGDVRRRPGLVALLYASNLLVALTLAVPFYFLLVEGFGYSGFSGLLLRDFDVLIWQEALAKIGAQAGRLALHLLWIVPLYMGWRVAASTGIAYALQQGGTWPFWRGVGRYGGRAFGLALFWLPIRFVLAGAIVVGAIGVSGVWAGEVGAFWTFFVLLPTLLIATMALVDLFERYGRLAIVVRHEGVFSAFRTGIGWPFRHGGASVLYVCWFFVALAVLVVPTLVGAHDATTAGGIWSAFVVQQALLFIRAAVSVAWVGSEVAWFERLWMASPPAHAPAAVQPAAA